MLVKEKSEGLLDYTYGEGERFSAELFERNIERNLKQARMAYQQNQA